MEEEMTMPKPLAALMLAYAVCSLLHFAHNAEFLAEYPNMPGWLSRGDVYLAWLGLTAIGALGYVLFRNGYRLAGLVLVAAYGFLGLDSLGHYTLAPFSAHTAMMNLTIVADVTTAGLVLVGSLVVMNQGRRR
jgi:hypothetical protein